VFENCYPPQYFTKNKMKLIYLANFFNEKIKIFDNNFVKKNKNKCYLIIDDSPKELCTEIVLNEEQKKKGSVKITLLETNQVTDMSNMFKGCQLLKTIEGNFKMSSNPDNNRKKVFTNFFLNEKDEEDITYIETKHQLLQPKEGNFKMSSNPDWDTKNIVNMSGMFYGCNSLTHIGYIEEWDTKNVTDFSEMFYKCTSLKCLPDISKWDIKNARKLSRMFYGCTSLKTLPDISMWDTKKCY
jgi:surface protein